MPGRSVALVVAAAAAAITVGVGSPVTAETQVGPDTGTTTAATVVPTSGAASAAEPAAAPVPSPASSTESSVGVVGDDLTDGLPGDRPNIVVIMTDDMREDELAFMPNVQRLIEDRGVRFVNSFSPYPLCCPARASFLTGQYTHNHGVWSNTDQVRVQGVRRLLDARHRPLVGRLPDRLPRQVPQRLRPLQATRRIGRALVPLRPTGVAGLAWDRRQALRGRHSRGRRHVQLLRHHAERERGAGGPRARVPESRVRRRDR